MYGLLSVDNMLLVTISRYLFSICALSQRYTFAISSLFLLYLRANLKGPCRSFVLRGDDRRGSSERAASVTLGVTYNLLLYWSLFCDYLRAICALYLGYLRAMFAICALYLG